MPTASTPASSTEQDRTAIRRAVGAADGEGYRGEDVDHGGEGRQQVGDRGVVELRRDLHPGPCGGGEREERVDGDQQPARARPGRVRLRCRGLRRCSWAQTWMTGQI